ncbi:MAG: TIGR03790 family protein [Bacteroidetes bacterium]|nr:TIGR03790 family protein [Bacteroidota bacterium]
MKTLNWSNLILILLLLLVTTYVNGQPVNYTLIRNGEISQVYEATNNPGDEVLIVFNKNYLVDENNNGVSDGLEIATYYAQKRNLPSENILGIYTSVNEQIERSIFDADFDASGRSTHIRQDLETYLSETTDADGNLLKTKIRFIVLTKGIPLAITALNSSAYEAADFSSVDQAITLLFQIHPIKWRVSNPYYNPDRNGSTTSPFIPFAWELNDVRLSYLVTRLDGYKLDDVFALVDRSLAATENPQRGLFVIDGDGKTYTDFDQAFDKLKEAGARVFPEQLDETPQNILTAPDSVLGYVSNGIYGGKPANYVDNLLNFTYAPGAIFSSYESFNGASFRKPDKRMGQVGQFIATGGSGGIGNVNEPWYLGIAREFVLFPAYVKGYTWAEAAYQSLIFTDFTSVVIGDPLMRIAALPYLQTGKTAFRLISSWPLTEGLIDSRGTIKLEFNENPDPNKIPKFHAEPSGITFTTYLFNNQLFLFPESDLPNNETQTITSESEVGSVSGRSVNLPVWLQVNVSNSSSVNSSPQILLVSPTGNRIAHDSSLVVIFSKSMSPASIYPIITKPDFNQVHDWQFNNRMLVVTHDSLKSGTRYQLVFDIHTKGYDQSAFFWDPIWSFTTRFTKVVRDIDGDKKDEVAYNSDRKDENGYETFSDLTGKKTSVFAFVDPEGDGRVKFLLKNEGKTEPFGYWNPNEGEGGYFTYVTTGDDDEDGTPDFLFDANGEGSEQTAWDPDLGTTRPTEMAIINSTPNQSAPGHNPLNQVKIRFSLPPDLTSLKGKTTLLPSGKILHFAQGSVPEEVLIQPDSMFTPLTHYTLKISKWVRNNLTDSTGTDFVLKFSTTSVTDLGRPFVQLSYPDSTRQPMPVSGIFWFDFSQNMKKDRTFFTCTVPDIGLNFVEYWVGKRLYLLPLQSLPENKVIQLTLDPNVESADSQLKITGTTQFRFSTFYKAADALPPQILIPPGFETDSIGINKSIPFLFSKGIMPAELQKLVATGSGSPFLVTVLAPSLILVSPETQWKSFELQTLNFPTTMTLLSGNSFQWSAFKSWVAFPDSLLLDIDADGLMEVSRNSDGNFSNGFEDFDDSKGQKSLSILSARLTASDFYSHLISTNGDSVPDKIWMSYGSLTGKTGLARQHPWSEGEVEYDVNDDGYTDFQVNLESKKWKPVLPYLVNTVPENGAISVSEQQVLTLQVNSAINMLDFLSTIRILPAINGRWSQKEPGLFIFSPGENWKSGQTYQVTAPGLVNVGKKFFILPLTLRFTVRLVPGLPQLTYRQFPSAIDSFQSVSGSMVLIFSEPVDTSSSRFYSFMDGTVVTGNSRFWLNDSTLEMPWPKAPTGTHQFKITGYFERLDGTLVSQTFSSSFTTVAEGSLERLETIMTDENSPAKGKISLIFNDRPDSSTLSQAALFDNLSNPAPFRFTYTGHRIMTLFWDNLKPETRYQFISGSGFTGKTFKNQHSEDTLEFITSGKLPRAKLSLDIDGDGQLEFALDADGTVSNGFESFLDTLGNKTTAILSARLTSGSWFSHLISTDGDSIPDLIWMAYAPGNGMIGLAQPHPYSEGTIEYDRTGDGWMDSQVNLATRKFTDVQPYLASSVPETGANEVLPGQSLTLTFNSGINLTDFQNAIRIDPAINGNWKQQSPGSFTFTPDGVWKQGTVYKVTAQNLVSPGGKSLIVPLDLLFSVKSVPVSSGLTWSQFPAKTNSQQPVTGSLVVIFGERMDTSGTKLNAAWDYNKISTSRLLWINDSTLDVAWPTDNTGTHRFSVYGLFRTLSGLSATDSVTSVFTTVNTGSLHPLLVLEKGLVNPSTGKLTVLLNDKPSTGSFSFIRLEEESSAPVVVAIQKTANRWISVSWSNLKPETRYHLILGEKTSGITFSTSHPEDTLKFQTSGTQPWVNMNVKIRQAGQDLVLSWTSRTTTDKMEGYLLNLPTAVPDTKRELTGFSKSAEILY